MPSRTTPTEKQLIEETKALMERQIAVDGELIRLRTAGDGAAISALVSQEDRAATAAIAGNLEKAVREERQAAVRQARRIRNQRNIPAGDRSRRHHADSDPRHRFDDLDPPFAEGTAGLAERHPGHQRGAGATESPSAWSVWSPRMTNIGLQQPCCGAPFTAWRRRCSSSTPRGRFCSPTRPPRRCFATGQGDDGRAAALAQHGFFMPTA